MASAPLAVDVLITALAEALLRGEPSSRALADRRPARLDTAALARARDFLDAECARTVRSEELEAATGLDRYALARQFRAACGTSPYRYALMRRLDRARNELGQGAGTLAAVAAETGFSDQAHMTRSFKAAYGVTPGRYRTLREGRNAVPAGLLDGVALAD